MIRPANLSPADWERFLWLMEEGEHDDAASLLRRRGMTIDEAGVYVDRAVDEATNA